MLRTRYIQQGILLGLGAAAPIGPVNVEIARRTLRGGFFHGFLLGCGAVSVDTFYAVLSSVSVHRLAGIPGLLRALRVAGPLFLCMLGVLCLLGAATSWRADPLTAEAGRAATGSAYLTGLLMTMLNPMTLTFWFVGVPGTIGQDAQGLGRSLPLICVGVFMGTLSWVVFFAGVLAWAGKFRRRWWTAAADALGGVTLLCFAGASLWSSVHRTL